jgi:peptidoglycan/xylan/chitin deacetylase (PgdA/CDA1 family)
MYHRVGEGTCGLAPQLTVTPRAFEQQIAWLARRGFTGIGPADWLAWREGRGTLPRKSLLITLDDAYAEIGLHALPVLRRYGFGALVFVVTGQLGGRNTWDPVYDHVRRPALMSARDVTYWARQGIEFGAHGRTHRDLRSLSGAELQGEICGSQHDLERILGAPVRWFSYPFGSYSVEAHALVAATYDLAFTVNEGLNGLSTDPHLLKRTMPGPGKRLLEIECRARLGRVPLSSARNMSRLRTRARTVGAAIASAGE